MDGEMLHVCILRQRGAHPVSVRTNPAIHLCLPCHAVLWPSLSHFRPVPDTLETLLIVFTASYFVLQGVFDATSNSQTWRKEHEHRGRVKLPEIYSTCQSRVCWMSEALRLPVTTTYKQGCNPNKTAGEK